MHKYIRRSKTRNLFLPIQTDEGNLTIRGRLHIYYLFFFCNLRSAYNSKNSHRFQSGQNTVVQGIQDALNSSVSFKHAVSICSIEFIWFSNYCMQSWAELASSSETEKLVNFLQSQRNPNVTWNVGGTLRLPGS